MYLAEEVATQGVGVEYAVKDFTASMARAVLAMSAGIAVDDLPIEAEEIIRRFGYGSPRFARSVPLRLWWWLRTLPMALGMIGAVVREQPDRGWDIVAARMLAGESMDALRESIEMSVKSLGPLRYRSWFAR